MLDSLSLEVFILFSPSQNLRFSLAVPTFATELVSSTFLLLATLFRFLVDVAFRRVRTTGVDRLGCRIKDAGSLSTNNPYNVNIVDLAGEEAKGCRPYLAVIHHTSALRYSYCAASSHKLRPRHLSHLDGMTSMQGGSKPGHEIGTPRRIHSEPLHIDFHGSDRAIAQSTFFPSASLLLTRPRPVLPYSTVGPTSSSPNQHCSSSPPRHSSPPSSPPDSQLDDIYDCALLESPPTRPFQSATSAASWFGAPSLPASEWQDEDDQWFSTCRLDTSSLKEDSYTNNVSHAAKQGEDYTSWTQHIANARHRIGQPLAERAARYLSDHTAFPPDPYSIPLIRAGAVDPLAHLKNLAAAPRCIPGSEWWCSRPATLRSDEVILCSSGLHRNAEENWFHNCIGITIEQQLGHGKYKLSLFNQRPTDSLD